MYVSSRRLTVIIKKKQKKTSISLDFRPAAARKFFEEGVKTLDGLINALLLLQDTYAQ